MQQTRGPGAEPRPKATAGDLAVCGGRAAFDEALHVGRPNVGDRGRLRRRIDDLLDRRWLTNHGPYVSEFERQVAATVAARHCVATCNATIGLQLLVRALGLSGEVILPSFTFVATAHALAWEGLTPVFCDVDPATHCLDPAEAARLITDRTSGIVGVHLWGRPCPVEALAELARRHGLALLFDAAHAFGCSQGPTMVGNFGRAEVFSFHATKVVNSFEGGAVVTNDDALAERLRRARDYGFAGHDHVSELGTNAKMSEVCGAMGLTGLESLGAFVSHNRDLHRHYLAGLVGAPGVTCLEFDERHRSNHQYVVLEVEEGAAGLTRDELLEVLWAENVLARRYFHPGCHRMEPYRTWHPEADERLPQTNRLCRRVLVLPTGTAVSVGAAAAVCEVVRTALSDPGAVRHALARRAPSGVRPPARDVDQPPP